MSEDNLQPLITQCPNCDTRFRVTEAQLRVASGRVRCGACLAVFDGTAHLSVDGEQLSGAEDADVDALLEELDEIAQTEPGQARSLPEIGDEEMSPVSVDELASRAGDDGALPDELLALEAELMGQMRIGEAGAGGNSSAAADADEAPDEPLAEPFHIEVVEGVGDERIEAPHAHAPDMPGETEPPDEPDLTEQTGEGEQGDAAAAQDDADWLDAVASEVWPDTSHEPDALEGEGEAPQEQAAHEEDEHEADVIELQALPEPTQTDQIEAGDVGEEAKRRRSWLTPALIVLALIGLPAQVLWFRFDAWVMDVSIRPVYQTLCDIAGCALPPLVDVSKIVSQKSFIRSHPDRPDARIVDVLLVNNAEFAQPYPLIELIATSLSGQLVAGRRFKPSEYLRGEVDASQLLPPRTPVHVSLEIQDPGEQALNFEVRFR